MANEEVNETLLNKLNGIEEYLSKLTTEVHKGFDNVDKRFEKVDQRFENVDKQFGNVNKQFEKVNNRLDKMDERFDRLEEIQQKDVVRLLQVMNRKVNRNSFDIDYLRNESSKHDMDIARLKKQIELID